MSRNLSIRAAGGSLGVLICASASFAAALAFWLITSFAGSYPAVARYGGALWIFLLVMIVLMPIVIPRIKRRGQRDAPPPACALPDDYS